MHILFFLYNERQNLHTESKNEYCLGDGELSVLGGIISAGGVMILRPLEGGEG